MFSKLKEKHESIEGYVSFILLLAMTIVMMMEVVARFIFQSSFQWSVELSRYLFVWFIFISASYAITQNTHIRIEGLNNLLPAKIRPYLVLIGNFLWVMLSLFVAYIGIKYSVDALNSGQISTVMRIPMGFIYLAIPVGYVLMALRLLLHEIKMVKKNPQNNT